MSAPMTDQEIMDMCKRIESAAGLTEGEFVEDQKAEDILDGLASVMARLLFFYHDAYAEAVFRAIRAKIKQKRAIN